MLNFICPVTLISQQKFKKGEIKETLALSYVTWELACWQALKPEVLSNMIAIFEDMQSKLIDLTTL